MDSKGMKELENTLREGIAALEPVPFEAVDGIIESMHDMLTLGDEEGDFEKFRSLLSRALSCAKTFEIHCWTEEPEWIALALSYGAVKDTGWKYGTVVSGEVSEGFCAMLMGQPRPSDTEIYKKLTPFFSIFLDNGFSSSHYGTEVFTENQVSISEK